MRAIFEQCARQTGTPERSAHEPDAEPSWGSGCRDGGPRGVWTSSVRPHSPRTFGGVACMGYSLSWLVVRGKSPRAVRDELQFRPTGEREEFPESGLSAVEMPNGWYVIV